MNFKEAVEEIKKVVGDKYFSVQVDYTQFKVYSEETSWIDSSRTFEDAVDLFKEVLNNKRNRIVVEPDLSDPPEAKL
jgi:hypothetical protein